MGDTTLMAESEEELKSSLMRVKEESEKSGLKLNIEKKNILMASVPSLHGKQEKKWKQWEILFSWVPKSLWMVTVARKLKDPWKESYEKPRQCIKKQRHQFANKNPDIQSYGFPSSPVQMWNLNHKEGWVPWCF